MSKELVLAYTVNTFQGDEMYELINKARFKKGGRYKYGEIVLPKGISEADKTDFVKVLMDLWHKYDVQANHTN